jgi:hypothetical protein
MFLTAVKTTALFMAVSFILAVLAFFVCPLRRLNSHAWRSNKIERMLSLKVSAYALESNAPASNSIALQPR